MDSCTSSPARSLSPSVSRIMDEVFECLSPTEEEDKTFEQANSLDNHASNATIMDIDIKGMDIEFEDGTVITGSNTEDNVKDLNQNIATGTQKKKTRKRTRQPDTWKQNLRKKRREAGLEYEDIKGNLHEKRRIKFSCSCKYKCSEKINGNERKRIHEAFWKLSDTKKNHYYCEHVKRTLTARKRTNSEKSRKSYSLFYYFDIDNNSIRVCKKFFLGTLDISSNRIQYFFKNVQNNNTNVPRSPLKGKNVKKIISTNKKNAVREHIKSFPSIESHYCRASTSKTYLEGNLNLSKMYGLYCQITLNPVKHHMYKNIFDKEFNIAFHKPKKDLCEKCAQFKVNQNKTEEDVEAYEQHLKRKKEGKEERDKDRVNKDPVTAIITFDMENIFCLPKTNIGSHFYKQKLTCYNLTAHCNIDKVVYCSIWNEGICGRGGVHLANAVIKILKAVMKDNAAIEKIILWSDSCVPQNRNSFMSLALQSFLDSTDNLKTIEQKFCEPGHGNIQEIDSAHSVIEKHVRNWDIYSPLGLIKILNSIPPGKLTFKVLQMKPEEYCNYQAVCSKLNYKKVPYTQVKHLEYQKKEPFIVHFKRSFQDEFTSVRINKEATLRTTSCSPIINYKKIPKLPLNDLKTSLSDAKKSALESMLNTMPEVDKNFYLETFLKPPSRELKTSSGSSTTILFKNTRKKTGSIKLCKNGQNCNDNTNTPKICKTKIATRKLKF